MSCSLGRGLLGELPSTLIIHLQRFTINLQTFETEKLNSAFEVKARISLGPSPDATLQFPDNMNFERFTEEGMAWREAGKTGPDKQVVRFIWNSCSESCADSPPRVLSIRTIRHRRSCWTCERGSLLLIHQGSNFWLPLVSSVSVPLTCWQMINGMSSTIRLFGPGSSAVSRMTVLGGRSNPLR